MITVISGRSGAWRTEEIAMRYNIETMELRRGNQTLTVAQEFIGGVVRYIGRVDGRVCVQSPTKEGAVCSLLRRLAYSPAA